MRKRLIYRCDDVGFTETYDKGIFEVIDAGIGSAADVMFDAEHVEEALKELKKRPWLSVGWHRHLWERPVLPAEEVPSLVNAEGRFAWGHRNRAAMDAATYEDAYKEFRAEMDLCHRVLGRYPDVAQCQMEPENELERAFRDVVIECGIVHNCYQISKEQAQDGMFKHIAAKTMILDQWKDKHILSASIAVGHQYDVKYIDEYKPILPMTALKWSEEEEIYFYGWHPGYLDLHILQESSCNVHRVIENRDALSKEYRDWIIENHVELISFRDALYDTNEFQDHLKEISSPLWIGNK